MDRKYQIFVSSPQTDLHKEREAAVKAILQLGHIPVGMEMFNAADEDSWKLITRYIDDSDYYVLILAHRYGSLAGDISFTEKEYDYAILKGVPTFGFVIDKSANWQGDLTDREEPSVTRLNDFKAKVAKKQIAYWSNKDDLAAKIMGCLATQIPIIERPGWVRGGANLSSEVAAQMTILSREVARLSAENSALRETANEESKFAMIDQLADPAECQAAIWMFETGKDMPAYTWFISGGSIAQLGSYDRRRLETVGIFRRVGGGTAVTLSDEGKRFAAWLIQKGRKARTFRMQAGGWGPLDENDRKHAIKLNIPFDETDILPEPNI